MHGNQGDLGVPAERASTPQKSMVMLKHSQSFKINDVCEIDVELKNGTGGEQNKHQTMCNNF